MWTLDRQLHHPERYPSRSNGSYTAWAWMMPMLHSRRREGPRTWEVTPGPVRTIRRRQSSRAIQRAPPDSSAKLLSTIRSFLRSSRRVEPAADRDGQIGMSYLPRPARVEPDPQNPHQVDLERLYSSLDLLAHVHQRVLL